MPHLTDVMEKVSNTIMATILFLLSIIMLLTLLQIGYARSLFLPMSVWFVLSCTAVLRIEKAVVKEHMGHS